MCKHMTDTEKNGRFIKGSLKILFHAECALSLVRLI